MKYVFEFQTGWACDIMAEISDHIYTIDSQFSKKELIEEMELRFHERGEEIKQLLKEKSKRPNVRKKHKESDEEFLQRKIKTREEDDKKWEHMKRDIKILDISLPSEDFEYEDYKGIFELKHGFTLSTLEEWFNRNSVKKS